MAVILPLSNVFSQRPDYTSLQPMVRAVVDKVYPAVVSLALYDTSASRLLGGMFSGVVISPEGVILTAAHAASPKRVYKVIFPDGREALATGLGRIASVDAALVQITSSGNWPHAEMGTSSALQPSEPCISMGYPGSLLQKAKPVVRFGYVGEALTSRGFIRSTCLMEPGDSGGPLFDLNGRVTGIHSRIEKPLESNFEIPVDVFKKYWHSLLAAESYEGKNLPLPETVEPDFSVTSPIVLPSPIHHKQISKLEKQLENNCLSILSSVEGQSVAILGTLVSMKGLLPDDSIKGYSYIISKSSMVGDAPRVQKSGSGTNTATVIKRDDANDLVLLKIPGKSKYGVDMAAVVDTMLYYQAGRFLLSPDPGKEISVSVLGAAPLSLIRRSNGAFLGISSEVKEGAVVLTMVNRRSAAGEAKLEPGDKVVSINGTVIKETEDIAKIISSYHPLDTIVFTGIRQDSLFARSIVLQARPPITSSHIAEFFEDGKSARRDGFKTVLVHDGKIKPSGCGGPLFDMDGRFLGLNIARLSRTSTLAIPSIVIQDFLRTAFSAPSLSILQ